jgi:glucokinase
VGGTKIAAGVVDLASGEILARRVLPTAPERGGEAVLTDALTTAEELMTEARTLGGMVESIGVGVAELVDARGNVCSSHLIRWRGLAVRDHFARLAPAVVESDVRAAALGEARYGAGREFHTFAYVTVGTGISSCLVQDGRPFAGARGNAMLLASAPLTSICPHCGTRHDQILEEYAGGPAIAARYSERSGRAVDRGEEVLAAVTMGDRDAAEIVRSAGEALGNSVAFLVNVLDPEAVVVGGGLGLAGGLYWESFVAATREHVWSEETRTLPIVPAALGTDSGLVGAARAAWEAGGGRRTAGGRVPSGRREAEGRCESDA